MSANAAPIRVALVEDNVELREEILAKGLRAYGFEVVGMGESKYLFLEILKQPFDVVVIDVGLPRENGLDVARQLREVSNAGIVILTSNRRREVRLTALMESADAFLAKPVELDVLAATLHSVTRRVGRKPSEAPLVAPPSSKRWRMEPSGWALQTPEGLSIPLNAGERAVIQKLLKAAGRPVEREALYLAIDPDPSNFDAHRLDMMIHRLRNKVSRLSALTLPLQTTRGVGYSILEGEWDLK